MTFTPLPIDPYLESVADSLIRTSCLVLEAPPGTGKTTRVAPALLQMGVCQRGCIALIQPRRIAARAAAARIAYERQTLLGEQIGYQVRFDSRCSPNTRLISMTPGILLRRIQSDSMLEQFSAVVLDEFHERSQEMDLLLGMIRQLQLDFRPELRIVVMSATLSSKDQIAAYLGDSPVLQIAAPSFPVQIRYTTSQASHRVSIVRRIVQSTVDAIKEAVELPNGDVLVFLPGVGEIMQVQRELQIPMERAGWELRTLYGDLPADQQDSVLRPSDRRRLILSTNIAETSLTIDGVRIVVDSGWARVKRFHPASGLDTLRLEPISQASAGQRAGRAGRTQPGICFRLWDEISGRSRPEQLEPEVLRTDLAGPVLQLLCWGVPPEQFHWLTPPSSDAILQARNVLECLGAIRGNTVTGLGKLLLTFPLHPRLARLLVEAHRLKIPSAGTVAATLLSERDLFFKPEQGWETQRLSRHQPPRSQRKWSCDLTARVQVWYQYVRDGNPETEMGLINPSSARNLARVSQQFEQVLLQELGPSPNERLDIQLQQSLLSAFPDRLAKRRSPGSPKALMVGGKGVQLDSSCGVTSELFLCLDVEASGADARVRLASAIEPDWLPSQWIRTYDERFFNPTQQAVVTRRRTAWMDLILEEQPIGTPLDQETACMLARVAASQFERILPPKDKELHSMLSRIRWLSGSMPEAGLPSLDETFLSTYLVDWCSGLRSMAEVRQLPWKSLVGSLLTAEQHRVLDQQAPESISLPSGRSVLLRYEPGQPPVLAARIQEFFGWTNTPRLAGGRVPLVLHLLAPNQRCQQITDDLSSFWKNTYPSVRKELRGRYPKHHWPENPLDG